MGLKQDPVRLLIADDVGIGKTIEAALLAKELLDRGEVTRMAVLCPPHLAEQWQRELKEKFQSMPSWSWLEQPGAWNQSAGEVRASSNITHLLSFRWLD